MINLTKYTYYYFIILLFSPLLSFISLSWFSVSSQYYMGAFISLLGLGYIFSSKRIKIPSYAWIFLIYILYTFIWSYLIGEFETRGIKVIIKSPHIHTFFALILIHNYNFSENFVNKVIPIIKYTVIIAAIVSLIQVVNYSFLDANPIWSKGVFDENSLSDLYNDRRASIFGYIDPNEAGLSYIPLLSVLIGVLLYQKYRFYYLYLIMGGITAILTNGRYVMIGFLLITFQVFLVQKAKIIGFVKYLFLIIISGLLLLQILSSFGYNFNDWLSSRLFAEGSIEETTRYKAIANFMIFFPQQPLFGYGHMTEEIKEASASVGSSQIHVGYLSHLVYFGIVGSFFLFLFWFLLARKFFITAKASGYWGSFLGFLVFLWANATLVTFHIFFYGLIFTLIFDKYFANKVLDSQ